MNPTGTEGEPPRITDERQKRDTQWGVAAPQFQRWPALLAILAAMALYVTLPAKLYYGPIWLLPAVEGALFVALLMARRIEEEGYEWQRGLAISLIAAMTAANIGSLILLIHALIEGLVLQRLLTPELFPDEVIYSAFEALSGVSRTRSSNAASGRRTRPRRA